MSGQDVMVRRVFAALIDYGIYFVLSYCYARLFGYVRADGGTELIGVHHIAILFVIWILLFPFMEDWFGYTLGKGLLDLKVVSNENKRLTFMSALKRHLLDPFDVLLSVIVMVTVWRSETPRRLGDRWGHTKVVRESKYLSP